MANKSAKRELIELYGKRCMATLSEENITFHHLCKRELGGPANTNNGSLLSERIHKYITKQEYSNEELYNLINECLQLYKICMAEHRTELVKQYEEEVVPQFQRVLRRDKK